ncbi:MULTISPECIES: BtrH N-terminal domain-containing protein [unclassified Neisseria]|uniref:BtrH N-terminal domain-containing protein n=1 Tax=unclassified Neisseria TaxID=2623750 RepID=UPI0026655418|nr:MULTISPECIES: BtrH N-terminal domain-containing protein [unclassified Neisseria]MDO1508874.1 BtrH N-terminal domain-containing protein [Neisseria sp. MVDL19-042950]MDO1515133.1 BtrH N-terminal domain-containing protein [Neisseria sp. MVDL18-041461]MDO1562493.1 BtrH N-terminal domain-containing protein [Neisseria sp. MVDL20-010259]
MIEFHHQHTAHCESGVMSTLLKHHGYDLNEAMIFGLASALTFVYLPVVKLAGMPLISYRMPPKGIIKNTCKNLGIRLNMRKFSSAEQGRKALDEALAAGKLVGLQTSVFWLPYFPEEMRFHFNAHNLLVYDKEDGDYLISDPVFETVQRCAAEDLQRARFAKGALAAKGLMYTIDGSRPSENWSAELPRLIRKAVGKNAKQMLAPVFFVGVRGIRTVAKQIEKLAGSGKSEKYKKLYLGHIVRMQEEIGTGGAGFRYLYAYFLEQAADICGEPAFQTASQRMTAIGDQWRKFASLCVKQCKRPSENGYRETADFLRKIADAEEKLWLDLKNTRNRIK